jgi:hypothetical protein
MNPVVHSPTAIKQRHHRWYDNLSSPVHEKFALLACNQVVANGVTSELEGLVAEPNSEHPLIRGVQWNDDPNNLLRNGHKLEWLYWMTDAKDRSERQPIDRTFYLQYRSHFGDLQFLHGMANKNADPAKVQRSLIDWAHFAYDVATGVITPTTRFRSLENSYAFIRLFSGTSKMNWTVQRFFANVGDKPGTLVDGLTGKDIPWLAVGALMHTVHDSYCDSHVERESPGSDLVSSRGGIRCFLDYSSQNSSLHKAKDLEPMWIDLPEAMKEGPLGQSVWLLTQVLTGQSWDGEVEKRFREQVFVLATENRRSDAGNYHR